MLAAFGCFLGKKVGGRNRRDRCVATGFFYLECLAGRRIGFLKAWSGCAAPRILATVVVVVVFGGFLDVRKIQFFPLELQKTKKQKFFGCNRFYFFLFNIKLFTKPVLSSNSDHHQNT